MTKTGQFVYSPISEHIVNSTIVEIAEENGSSLVEGAQRIISGESGFLEADGVFQNERKLIAFTPIESNQWIFAVSIPEVEAYQSFRESLPYLILPFVAALILTYGAIFLVAGTLTRPIENLQEAVLNIAGGDLKVKAAEKSNDEIGSLARSFNKMTEDLNSNISKLAIEESERLSAEEANQAKSRFLSHMSHELRTPLNGILGYAQVLRKNRELAPKQQQMVDSIVNCGDYLLTLINDVLDLSKIEAGKMELDLAATDLHRLIMDVSDVVSMRAENKGLKFIVNISAEVPVGVLIDGSKVRQILINLLGNAVKFCEKGSIELKVSESPKGQLSFSVIDTGLGISVEQQKNVFAAFKQAEGGKKAGGTGLGLAIAKQLSESMSGALTFSSELAVGTTFTLAIPFEEVEHDALSTKEDFGNYDSTVKCLAQGQDFTILVVDDRQTNREVLEQLLEMTGFKTILADDGDTALDILQKEKIDLVLMDVRMPRLNGVEALKEIRQDSKLKDLLVFAVTASVFPDFHEKALKVGFDDFIGKPFKASELFEKLKRHLKASFIYEEESEAHLLEKSAEDSEVSLPPEALDQFHQALEIKNITAMKKITDELMIDDRYKSSGEKIMSMLEGFEFDSLENFLKQSE
jgi:signal transduction histidine kinase/DNA-binding response OmpR family regulator